MKHFFFFVVLLVLSQIDVCFAKSIDITSPDGELTFTLNQESAGLDFSVTVDGQTVIRNSPISITINGATYPDADISKVSRKTVKNTIIPTVKTICATIEEHCNETVLKFGDNAALCIRAYNDGVAYRWESFLSSEHVKVNAEKVTFNFTDDYNMYYPVPNGEDFFSHQECDFLYTKLSEIDRSQKAASTPALIELGSRYMLITDVNVEHYPGLWIKAGGGTKLEGIFPHYPAETKLERDRNLIIAEHSDYISESTGARSFPWRAFVIAEPKAMLTSTMLYSLADPCRLEDTSWIKPGMVAWDWWNAWNITDVPFKAGINQETYKNYIDFASANGLSYVILDEGWSESGADNLLKVVSELNIGELVKYGRTRNVGIILWMTSTALERSFDKAFEQFDEWGIKGLKIDFMQRDDQMMMDFCQKTAAEAAKHKLIVDYHGGSKPTGLQRTYPNVLTHESVLGLEQSKWSTKASPDMAVLLPFTRMMAGPMDYTPGGMDNFTRSQFESKFNDPGTLGTRCHQLAMYVTYLSPLQMLADTPTKYRKNPDSMEFLREVPTTWDETVVLEAEVGKVIALARRDGNRWFLSAMTNWDKRKLDLPLSFLGNGNYTLRYWADGPESANDATDTTLGQMTVNATSVIKINLSSGGGYASIIEPH